MLSTNRARKSLSGKGVVCYYYYYYYYYYRPLSKWPCASTLNTHAIYKVEDLQFTYYDINHPPSPLLIPHLLGLAQ
jgi:hypothetical protein